MMIHEFTERTKYTPSAEEYRYIEDSYYDSNMYKDDFCKAWLKLKRSGAWETELRLRKIIDAQKAHFAADLAEKQETIEWYSEQFEKLWGRGLSVSVKCKDGQTRQYKDVTCKYVDNGTVKFYSIVEKSGWTTCYKVDDVETINFSF